MNNRSVEQSYGWNLGIVSGLFAALQVLISASTSRANIYSIESMRWALSRLTTGGGNPVPLLGSLASVVLVTYAAMLVTGAISLVLCWHAGRLTAYVQGRRAGGASAGFRVALLSGGIWMVFTIIISFLMHSDGTITGVFASTRDGSSLLPQLGGVLLQELIFAAIGLGLGAWAGYLGSGRAPLSAEPPAAAAFTAYGAQPMYPAYPAYPAYPVYPPLAGYPGYPGNGGYPVMAPPGHGPQYPYPYPSPASPSPNPPQPTGDVPPSYPPPPDYYRAAGAATPADTAPKADQPETSERPAE